MNPGVSPAKNTDATSPSTATEAEALTAASGDEGASAPALSVKDSPNCVVVMVGWPDKSWPPTESSTTSARLKRLYPTSLLSDVWDRYFNCLRMYGRENRLVLLHLT